MDNFLSEEDFAALCDAVGDLESERKEADLFSFEQSDDLTNTKIKEIQLVLKRILELKGELKELFNIEIKNIDCMASFYYDCDYLLPHDDRLGARKVAYILYLTTPDAGGELVLYKNKKPWTTKKELAPVVNRLVLFPVSKESLHEVQEVLGENPRISLTGWLS